MTRVPNMTRSSGAIIIVFVALAVAGCTTSYGYVTGSASRTFENPKDGIAWVRSEFDRTVARVEPLPSPIGGSSVIIVPTRELLVRVVEAEFPHQPNPDWAYRISYPPFPQRVEMLEMNYLMFAHAAQRRNILTQLRIVRADSPEGISNRPEGYIIWIKKRLRENWSTEIIAAGETQWTELKPRPVPSTAGVGESLRAANDAIERFVESHRRSGQTERSDSGKVSR
jgi:hypothetical protein